MDEIIINFTGLDTKLLSVKLLIVFTLSFKQMFLLLIETVYLSTHDICFS